MTGNCNLCWSAFLPDEKIGRCSRCSASLCEICGNTDKADLCRSCISALATAYVLGFVAAIEMDSMPGVLIP